MKPLGPLKRLLAGLAARRGLDIVPVHPEFHEGARRTRLLAHHEIDTVLDVGANIGQFATQLRRSFGYRHRIVSFEPLSEAFAELKACSESDPDWDAYHCALGRNEAKKTIHVAANSVSSSLLEMLRAHEDAAPESKVVATEQIQVRTLDSMFADLCSESRHVLLKIDTQGYEAEVLHGARESLARIDLVQIEMSLVRLYAQGPLFAEMLAEMQSAGFEPIGFETGFVDVRTGHALQVDGLFARS